MGQLNRNINNLGMQTVYLRSSIAIADLLSDTSLPLPEQLRTEASIANDIENSVGQLGSFQGASLQGADGAFYLRNTALDDLSDQVSRLIDVTSLDFSTKKYAVSFGSDRSKPYVAITSPVLDENQQGLGYLHLFFNSDVYGISDVSADQENYLFSSDAQEVLCCSELANTESATQMLHESPGLEDGLRNFAATGNDIVSYRNGQKDLLLGAFYQNDAYPLVLLTSVKSSDMLAAVLPFTVLQGGVSLVLFGLLVLVVYVLFNRTTKPVSDMIEQCSQLALGNDAVEIKADQDRELDKLANAFNGYRKKLETAAYVDALLGIGTRQKCLRDIDGHIAATPKKSFAIFLVDIKEFGKYNDVFSLEIGDQILKEVARRLAKLFDNRVYRINGDVFLGFRESDEDVDRIAEAVHEDLRQKFKVGSSELEVECQISICCYPAHGRSGVMLLEHVQSALHQIKYFAGAHTVVYDDAMASFLKREEEVLGMLRQKIADNTLEVWYQPIYHLGNCQYLSAEALLRLRDDQGHFIPPLEVVLIAEKNNVVDLIGDYVLAKTCTVLKKLQQTHNALEYIQVNLSVQQLSQKNYAAKVLKQIREAEVEPSHLGMEVTETMVIQSFSTAIETLEELRNCGVRIAMDDFGSGYSGINYLSKLPIDILKLDRELVLQVGESEEQLAFVKTVVQLAKVKKLKAVAEGVETLDILEKITACGVDCIQGYYYSKPLCETEFLAFLDKEMN
ncbi:MAG: EAL domain-containing protein [Raoultibacter sp.]